MKITLITPPLSEPVLISELKQHLRLDSCSFATSIDTIQSLVPDNYAIAADYVTHVGIGVSVSGYKAMVNLNSGTNGATGTVDAKIQESDDDITYTDWATGAFTQVTTANDNAIQEKEYTGIKQYIRVVAKVLLAVCDFAASITRSISSSVEDDMLEDMIVAARENAEDVTRRGFLTQTWDYYLDEFPNGNSFKIPFGNLQSVTHVKYTDSDGTQTTMTVSDDYLVETNGEGLGKIVLPYSDTWPSFTAYPSKPIVVRFICGWTAVADVPDRIKHAVKMMCTDLYENRSEQEISSLTQGFIYNKTVTRLLASLRLYDEFK